MRAPGEAVFVVDCPCGRDIQVRPEALGRRVRCTGCGGSVVLLVDESTGETVAQFSGAQPLPQRAAPPSAAAPAAEEPPRGKEALLSHDSDDPVWNRRYWFLAAALIPLFFSFFHHRDLDLRKRVEKTLANAPPVVAQRIDALGDEATLDDLLSVLPTGRLDGALLSRKTRAHWIYALVSAAFFLGTILVLFPRGTETARQLLLAGAFTGTVGIFFLLAVQAIASSTGGMWIRGGGKAAIIYLILKFIGFSYRAALDPDNGFLASFFGFTCGVGLCEELSKAIPVIFHYRTGGKMTWRGASLWGMASGVGFGVSEGITYSSDFYNGIEGGEIYIVRFVSCVALHAFWAAAAGIALSKASDALSAPGETRAAWIPILKAVAVPMVLHGLYDTLLKQDHGIPAFVVAALSFAWLALQIELARKEDGRSAAPALNSA